MSISLLYILSNYYDEIILYKPDTSRPANSEKYVVCKNFRGISSSELGKLLSIVHNWDNFYNGENLFIYDILKNDIPDHFIESVIDFNNLNGNKQLESIIKTLKIIDRIDKKDPNIKSNQEIQIYKAINWCIKNNVDININSNYLQEIS